MFQKLRNNHKNEDCVAVFAIACLVYLINFLLNFFCYSGGNLNNDSGDLLKLFGTGYVSGTRQGLPADCTDLAPV